VPGRDAPLRWKAGARSQSQLNAVHRVIAQYRGGDSIRHRAAEAGTGIAIQGVGKTVLPGKEPSTWPIRDGYWPKRVELGYRRLLAVVSEMPVLFEYIDFGRLPGCLQIAKTGGYRVVLGVKSGRPAGIIPQKFTIIDATA